VAYPIVATDAETEVIDNEYGIILGIWGKDIQDIDSVTEPENANSADRQS